MRELVRTNNAVLVSAGIVFLVQWGRGRRPRVPK
jgi:hypothetical protein